MREKKEVVVISFKKYGGALELEELLAGEKRFGRVIPLPSAISAGCGFAWRADLDVEEELLKKMKENNILYDKITYLRMY